MLNKFKKEFSIIQMKNAIFKSGKPKPYILLCTLESQSTYEAMSIMEYIDN